MIPIQQKQIDFKFGFQPFLSIVLREREK